jgi:hypothetical protein
MDWGRFFQAASRSPARLMAVASILTTIRRSSIAYASST